jgi:capsular exopolysaccharide synthesis family protein
VSEVNPSAKASVDLRSQLAIVRRYWWFTAMVLVAALVATFVLTQRQERIYSSSARVVLRTSTTATSFRFSSTGPRELSRTAENEASFAQSASFRAQARELSPSGVSVGVQAKDDLLVFTGRGTEPAAVAEAATTWAELYVVEQYAAFLTRISDDIEFLETTILELRTESDLIRSEVAELESLLEVTTDSDQFARLLSQKVSIEALLQPQLGPIDQQIASFTRELADLGRITLFLDEPLASARLGNAASVPTSPVSPNVLRNLLTGAFLGLALGMSIPFVWHALSDKIGDTDDVMEISQQSILGVVPAFESADAYAIEVLERPTSFASAQYQSVLTAIEFAAIANPITSMLFTSALPGEGKTTTAVNIAALASKHRNVLLIDADMRRPKVHLYAQERNDVGLTDVLMGEADPFDVRKTFERNGTKFDVLTAGRKVEDPAMLLRGEVWSDLLADQFMYDLIVVDAPPVLAVTDSLLAGQPTDGQIILSRSDVSKREDLSEAMRLLATNGTRSLGVVINHERPRRSRYADYDAYSSED